MPSELIRLPALCLSLAVDKDLVDISKYGNTEKNIARVHNTLYSVDKLYVSLNERREATFFDNDIRIHFKLSKKKEKITSGFCLDTIDEGEEAEMDTSMCLENRYQADFVEEVVTSLLYEKLTIDDLEESLREEETSCQSFNDSHLEQDQLLVMSGAEEVLMLSESFCSIKEEFVEENEDENQQLLDRNHKGISENKDENQNVDDVLVKIVEMSPKLIKGFGGGEVIETSEGDSAYQSNPTSSMSSMEEALSNESSLEQDLSLKTTNISETINKVPKDQLACAEIPASLRSKTSTKHKIRREKKQQKVSGWSVGDSVIAMWMTDGVWRRGIIHELDRSHAYVIAAEEEGVRATRLRIQDLKPANIPLELLNSVEEEFSSWTSSINNGEARRMN